MSKKVTISQVTSKTIENNSKHSSLLGDANGAKPELQLLNISDLEQTQTHLEKTKQTNLENTKHSLPPSNKNSHSRESAHMSPSAYQEKEELSSFVSHQEKSAMPNLSKTLNLSQIRDSSMYEEVDLCDFNVIYEGSDTLPIRAACFSPDG